MRKPRWGLPGRITGRDPKRDVQEEIDFHLDMRRRDYEGRGLAGDEAARAAQERFGDVEGVRRRLEDFGEKEAAVARRRDWLSELRQDARYALRMMVRTPLVFVVIVGTLALGIGATTAMFGVVNAVLVRPLPYEAPDRLVRLWEVTPRGVTENVVSPGNYVDWRARAVSFEVMGAHQWPYGISLTGDGEPMQVITADITPSTLEVLGVAPVIGRTFTQEEVDAGALVVLLSHGLWRFRFGGDREILGRTITLNAVPTTVIGVMPADFDFPLSTAQVWRPIRTSGVNPNERRSHNFGVIGRLRDDVPLERARAEMSGIAGALAAEYPEFMEGWNVNVLPLHDDLVAEVRPLLLVLLGGVMVVLLIACANIANLLLARSIAREREMAVRGALGAGRSRLVRQALTESLLLALLGGAAGVAVAAVALDGLLALAPGDIPLIDEVRFDPRVFGFAAAVTLLSTLGFGLLPALRLARSDLHTSIRAGDARAGGSPHTRARSVLLVAEVALSLVLLAGAGLLVRSAAHLNRIDYGYRVRDLVALSLDLPRTRYQGSPAHVSLYERLIERMRAVPGVVAVAGTSEPPAAGFMMTFSYAIEGRPSRNSSGREDPQNMRAITPDYFRVLGVPLVSGRTFDARDNADASPVAVINQMLAKKHWPDESPIGKRISTSGAEGPWMEIVGVVGDTRLTSADDPPIPAIYIPFAQKTWTWMSWMTIVLRTRPGLDAAPLASPLRSAVWELDGDLPVPRIAAVEDLYGESLGRRRFATTLLSGFAAVALLLGVLGMYGVLAYAVAQRRREIGIRVALGATRGAVIRGVLAQAMRLAATGILIGIAGALALTRTLRSLLYEVSPTDPVTLAAVAAIIAAVALVAAWVPAARATRISPVTVIRE